MGYYMGDASAARHQGGFFSFVGKAISTVSRFVPGPLGLVGQVAGKALAGGRPPSLPGMAASFIPSLIPGVQPMPSSSPMIPVSTPPSVLVATPGATAAPARAPRVKSRRRARPKVYRAPVRRRSSTASRRAANAATRRRLRSRGYRF